MYCDFVDLLYPLLGIELSMQFSYYKTIPNVD